MKINIYTVEERKEELLERIAYLGMRMPEIQRVIRLGEEAVEEKKVVTKQLQDLMEEYKKYETL